MTRSKRAEGIIIGRQDFGELDKIVTIFSQREGKIRTLAKGVRKINSRRLGSLELGNLVKLFFHRGKNFDIITEVAVSDGLAELKNNHIKLGAIIFACEILNALLPEKEENQEIYRELLKLRSSIKKGKIKEIVFFEAKILQILGYGLDKKIINFLKEGKLRQAHLELKQRIEAITERPLKTLAIFN